jgi:hypothetical protein
MSMSDPDATSIGGGNKRPSPVGYAIHTQKMSSFCCIVARSGNLVLHEIRCCLYSSPPGVAKPFMSCNANRYCEVTAGAVAGGSSSASTSNRKSVLVRERENKEALVEDLQVLAFSPGDAK